MKNLYDVLNEVTESVEDLPTIYCDMDMVLCDFLKGAEEILGVPFQKRRREQNGLRYLQRKISGKL